MKLKKLFRISITWYTYTLFIILFVACSALIPGFSSVNTFSTILTALAPLFLVTLGENLVILTGEFDLSVGSVATLTVVIASFLLIENILLGILLCLAVGVIIGTINGFSVTKLGVPSFITTLGTMTIITGLAFHLRPVPGGIIPQSFVDFVKFEVGGFRILLFLIVLVAGVGGWFLLRKTDFGKKIYAVGRSESKSFLIGLRATRIKIFVFIISGVLSAIAGLLLSGIVTVGTPIAGSGLLFKSITAVLLGGTLISGGEGKFEITIGAVLLISLIWPLLSLTGFDPRYENVIVGSILIGSVVLSNALTRKKKGGER